MEVATPEEPRSMVSTARNDSNSGLDLDHLPLIGCVSVIREISMYKVVNQTGLYMHQMTLLR